MTIIRGRVERIVPGGHGIVRTDEGVVFCDGVIPGEFIEFRLVRRKRGAAFASEITILEESTDRIAPACPHYGACGGCDFMHMTYPAELRAKRGIVEDALRRIGGLTPEIAPFDVRFLGAEPTGYRNSVRLQSDRERYGYCRKETESVVPIEDCLIAAPAVREVIRSYVSGARQGSFRPESVTIRAGDDGVSVIETAPGRTQIEGAPLRFRLGGRGFEVDPRSFFQVNTRVAEWMIDDLRAAVGRGKRLLDFFAGVGLFAISLADLFEESIGYEISRTAIEDFRRNAAGLEHVRVIEWNAAVGLKEPIGSDDIVLVDPPRTGLAERLRQALVGSGPRMLVYISCGPATLARDLKALVAGGFRFRGPVRLYDMFPRTGHVETMTCLERD